MFARPARIDFNSQPCSARPASKRSSRWYSWRARLFSAMVPPPFALSLPAAFLLIAAIVLEPPQAGEPTPRAIDAPDRTQRPGGALRRPDVRTGKRHTGVSAPVRVVRQRAGARIRTRTHRCPAGSRTGRAADVVHHREHAGTAAPHRHAAARWTLPQAVRALAVPRAGRIGVQGQPGAGIRTAQPAAGARTDVGIPGAGRP